MLAGKAYMEHHNQVIGIVYRNVCPEYGQTIVMANQPDVMVVDKQMTETVIDVTVPSNSNIK